MCQAATKSLGSGRSEPPSGEQGVDSPTSSCRQQKKPASILVEVYEGNSANILKDVTVSLTGPSSGKPLEYQSATKYYTGLDPGDGYEVKVSYDNLEKFKAGRLIPEKQTGKLGPGETRRMTFRLFPPVSALLVQVVNKDTKQVITDTKFIVIVPKLKAKEQTDLPGSRKFAAEPGDYDEIEVDLSDPALRQRYVLAERGKTKVERGKGDSKPAQVLLAVRELRLVKVDAHFAPGVEDLDIQYQIRHMKDEEVLLQIKDAADAVVYERPLTKQEKEDSEGHNVIHWDGKTNETAGAFRAGQYINPLSGPYKAVLVHPITATDARAEDHEREFNVLYHSLDLELMKWEDVYKAASKQSDTNCPASPGKQQTMWVQYKLNELGFPAGPVDGTESEALRKGIRRFRQASKVLYQRPWEPSTDFEYVAEKPGVLDSLGSIDKPLLEELKKGMPKRVQLDPRVINDPKTCAQSKLYVEQDRFYLTMEEMGEEPRLATATIKSNAEKEWFNRPLFPLKATVFLQNKRDEKASAPAALGEVNVKWGWIDGSVDDDHGGTGKLPVNKTGEPSQTAVYVKMALECCRDKIKSSYHNARAAVGGLVTGTEEDERVVFRELPEPALPITVLPGGEAGTPIYTGVNESAPLRGVSVVLFSPSTIAGDSYQLGAELQLPNTLAPRQAQLLAGSMKKKEASTGWMTVWRRVRVAAHISWPTMANDEWDTTYKKLHPGKGGMDINRMWSEVRREYEDAFVEVSGPELFKTTANFPADFGQKFKDAIAKASPASTRKLGADELYWSDVADKGFLAAAYFSGDPPVKGMSETSPDKINQAVRALLEPEVNGPKPGDDPPRLKAFKKWVADWPVKDNGVADPKVTPLSTMEKDAYLVDAAAHFLKDPIWDEKTLGGNKTFFKPRSKVTGSTDLAPWAPPDDWVRANQDKSGTTVQAINDRILNFLRPELDARHATDENTDMPRAHGFGSLCFRGIPHWTLGKDQGMGFGDVALPFVKGDAFLKEAAKHYKAEMTRLAETRNMGAERKVLRYRRVAQPAPYAPSPELAERISTSLRDGVATAVNNVIKKTQVLLLEQLEAAVFAETEPGIVILDFKPHREVPLPSPTGQTENYLAKIFAMANGGGLVIIDQAHLQAYRWYHLFTHEVGHCLFLKHWKNAGGYDAMDHDHADENCQMSYCAEKDPAGKIVGEGDHYAVGKYQPHFCGKCNLKLRGWDLRAKTAELDAKGNPLDLLPASSDPSKKVVVIDYVDPIFPFVRVDRVRIPSPNLLEAGCTKMMAEMLGEDTATASKHWLKRRVNDAGVVRVIANPKLVMRGGRATMEWEVVPMETVPEGTPWPGPSGVGRTFDGKEKQAWIDDLEYYAVSGGLTAAQEEKVEMNAHFHYSDFTDLIHETWHLAQGMGGGQPLYEGPTDLLADMLGRWVAASATSDQDRFAYKFNPSYAESVLSVIDQWLPAMGLSKLADVYVNDAKHLQGVLADKKTTKDLDEQLMNSRAWEVRDDFKVKRPNDPIRWANGDLRSDLEDTITKAPVSLQVVLRESIHAFLDFLASAEATLTGPQRIEVAKHTGTQKFYMLAKLARRVRKQYSFTRALRAAQAFKRDADAAGKQMRDYDTFIKYLTDELKRFNDGKLDPSDEIEDTSSANDSYLR